MKKTMKIRLYPTRAQEKQFYEFCNTARFIYNESLSYSIEYYETNKKYPSTQCLINHIKDLKYNKYSWILQTPEAVTKQSIRDLKDALTKFFNKTSKFPKYKKKSRAKLSFYQRTDSFHQIDCNHIKITGIKPPVKIKNNNIPNHVYNTRVSYDGKYWYLSISYDVECLNKNTNDKVIGIDLGIKETITTSDGIYFKNINKINKVVKLEKRKKRLQRRLSNKYEINKQDKTFIKTSNIIKLEKNIKLIDRKLTNIRNTYRHTITKRIVEQEPRTIIVEDLNISGMLKNKYLSDSIRKQGFNDIISKLKYKCKLYGIELKIADRFYPSSKKCSNCGHIKKDLKLSDRTYNCNYCGISINRDYNAALNLKQYLT